MGEKGNKHTQHASNAAESLVSALSDIGDITSKTMFGCQRIFHDGKMFGIIDSSGTAFLKAVDFLEERFEKAGSEKHGRMPYYSIPASVLKDASELVKWANDSIRASKG